MLINQGVAQLRNDNPEAAYHTLKEALADQEGQVGAQHLAANCYNLGLACRRSGRDSIFAVGRLTVSRHRPFKHPRRLPLDDDRRTHLCPLIKGSGVLRAQDDTPVRDRGAQIALPEQLTVG